MSVAGLGDVDGVSMARLHDSELWSWANGTVPASR